MTNHAELRGLKVLIVEDESLVSMMIEEMLEDLGCEVAAVAARFDAALVQARTLAIEFALLDVNLGGHPTFPVAEILRERGIPFVFATGYGASGLPDAYRSVTTLPKPFELNELARVLSFALADRSGAPPVSV